MRSVIIMWFWLCLAVALPFYSRADQPQKEMSNTGFSLYLRDQQMKNEAELQQQRLHKAEQQYQSSMQLDPNNHPPRGRHSAGEIQRQAKERLLMEQQRSADIAIKQERMKLLADQQKAEEQKKEAEKIRYDENMIGTYFSEKWHQEEWFTTLPSNIKENYIAAYKNGYVNDRDMSFASNLEIINHERVQARGMEEYPALIRGQASFPPKPQRRVNMERRKNAPPPVAMNTAQAEAVIFPESILSFTLGMKFDDFKALSKNKNYHISDLEADSSHLMGIMGANQHSSPLDDNYWRPSGISRPYKRNSKPNCFAYRVNAAFVATLGANRFEVGFLEGRMVGMAIVYQTGSGYISALYNKICAKYPIIASNVTDDLLPMSKPQPSALLDMKGHSFLMIQTSFSVVIINVPLIKNIEDVKVEQKQRQEQQKQNEINNNIDSVFDGLL